MTMDVYIYLDREMAPDQLLARIDEKGKFYSVSDGEEEYLGWIDHEEGDVYDGDDFMIGWAEDDGVVIAYFEEEDEEYQVGYVNDQGEIYYYTEGVEEAYFGSVKDMQHYADGAAALLFYLEEEVEEE
jgi:hypothetical protein